MTECLLCMQELPDAPSWKSLFGLDERMIICVNCSKRFKRADIIKEERMLERVHSLYKYTDATRDYLHQFKFLQDIALADVFKNELRAALTLINDATIVPIPMHSEKKIDRTFAHVEELLKSAMISYENILDKLDTDSMGQKSKEQRLATLPLFKIKQNITITRTTYILVDDIYTTGTTLLHAATALKEAGAARVEAVTLIRAELKN